MNCTQCGAPLNPGLAFCPACGTAVAAGATPTAAGGGAQIATSTDGVAIVSFILGLLSLVLGFFTGFPAVVCGHLSRYRIRHSHGRLGGDGLAVSGYVLGYLGTIFGIVSIFVGPNFFEFGGRRLAYASSAIGSLRTLNTAEVQYQVQFPERGYAPDLASLGPGKDAGGCAPTAEHACLTDQLLGAPECGPTAWCTKSGYNINLHAVCTAGKCTDYVVTATPMGPKIDDRSFCTASDEVIHEHKGPPLNEPLRAVTDCQAWPPLG